MFSRSLDPLMGLLRIASPSGREREASAYWRSWGSAFSDAAEVDRIGNSYLHLCHTDSPKIAITAHIDELALMITHIDEGGYLSFDTMGRWDPSVLGGQRVAILTCTGTLSGVLGRDDIFRRSERSRNDPTRTTDYWIDIGATSRADAEQAVHIGDPVVIDVEPFLLTDQRIVARGLDDRAGCFVIGEVLRELHETRPPLSVSAVTTTQEEVGLRGAQVAAGRLAADVVIAVDLYSTSDTPGRLRTTRQLGEIRLGGGPVIARGPNIDPDLFNYVRRTAVQCGIPHQIEGEPRATSTDASIWQLEGGGAQTILLSIPNRYSHSPVEIVDRRDLENMIRLVSCAIGELGSEEWLCASTGG